jgi:hypothetical protein
VDYPLTPFDHMREADKPDQASVAGTMNLKEPDLHDQQKKLSAIEDRLTRVEATVRNMLILLIIVAAMVLTLVVKVSLLEQ